MLPTVMFAVSDCAGDDAAARLCISQSWTRYADAILRRAQATVILKKKKKKRYNGNGGGDGVDGGDENEETHNDGDNEDNPGADNGDDRCTTGLHSMQAYAGVP